MIANITTGKNAYGILNYNQLKVNKGKASVLSTRLIFEDPDGKYNVSKMAEEFHNSMPECIRTEKPIVHISLNPDPKDEIDDELLITMAEEYLVGMGWGNQPHIIYKHTDIERVHIHIVTTQVDITGRKINDSHRNRRSVAVTEELEKKYQQDMRDYEDLRMESAKTRSALESLLQDKEAAEERNRQLAKQIEQLGLSMATFQEAANGSEDDKQAIVARLQLLGGLEKLAFSLCLAGTDVDVSAACGRIKEFFELYQVCANRKQVETVCTNFLRIMEATKLDGPGHMYFVPRPHMAQVAIFEDFIGVLDQLNKTDRHLHANSFDVIDDAKQRDKMAIEFYSEVKREIALYQDRCDHFIRSGSRSPVIMDRWVMKIRALEEKKKLYEQVLQRELNDLDDEFSTLKLLGQELQIRASNLRFQRAA